MVVVIGGSVLEEAFSETRSLLHQYPGLRDSAAHLLALPNKVIGPLGLLYVQQREMATTLPHDKNVSVIGSGEATTCIIVILRHTGSGAVSLAHCDGCGTEEGMSAMLSKVQELSFAYPEGRLELHLIGGYSEPQNYAEKLFFSIMNFFHKQPVEVDLVTMCVGELNTTVRNGINWPILYGVGVTVKTGDIYPATFPDKGPEQELRAARRLTGGQQILDIYDCSMGLLKIEPFNYGPLRGIDLWLEQPDQVILQHLSTSPEVEPPHFVMKIRAALKYIQEHQFPAVTVFRDNRPHYYRRDDHTGMWAPFRY